MNEYNETKEDYNQGACWHTEKSRAYDWKGEISRFTKSLKGKRILDAGCGSGRDIALFIKQGFEVDGIDYSQEAIKIAEQKNPTARFAVKDLRKTGFRKNTFDGVWACASILNLKKINVSKALSEFNRILKFNGVLFISVKKGKGERLIFDQAGKRFFSFYQPSEIKKMTKKAGFKITYSGAISDFKLTHKKESRQNPSWILVFAEKAPP